MPAFSITQDKVACWDKVTTPSAYDTCCCFLLLTSNSSTAPEEAACGLPRASDPLGPLGPCIPWPSFTILFQEHRDRVQEPKHQLPNGLLEALTKQHQGAQFFFFFLLLSLFSLSVCLPTWANGRCAPISLPVLIAHLLSAPAHQFSQYQQCLKKNSS